MTAGTREQRSAEKKRQLLDAAERVYYRDGDLGLTVRRLAAEASTTSQTIYTYFGSRDAVIEAMYERALADVDRLLDALERAIGAGRTVEGAHVIVELASRYRRYCLDKPAQFRMLVTASGPDGTDPTKIAGRRRRLLGLVRSAANPGAAEGAEATGTTSPVVLAAVNGFVEAELHDLVDERHMADKLLGELVGALTWR
ncbi:MAG: TetR/AcrR family transcriptional regulator [Acidimicrobiia bacterium]|nr:TetR/AcrR family transcriptional regulator [Acidimicrobiia bacterium]